VPCGFSRAAARALSPHRLISCGPTQFLDSQWASCSHLVFPCSPPLALFPFVLLPLHSRLTPHITQRVPTPFQQRVRAVDSYPTTCFQIMSLSLFLLSYQRLFFLSFVPSTITYPVSSNATSPKALFPSPTDIPTLLLFTQLVLRYSKIPLHAILKV
jgi:hypothetical protein